MSGQLDPSSSRRWLEIAAAAVIVAIPIALAAVTWEPLQPLPAVRELERTAVRTAVPTTTPEWRPRQTQRERARQERRENEPPRAIATPGRQPRAPGTPQTQDAP